MSLKGGGILLCFTFGLCGTVSWAADPSDQFNSQPSKQPYIDEILHEIHEKDSKPKNPDSKVGRYPFLDAIQEKLQAEKPAGSFIEEFKATDVPPEENRDENYTEKLRSEMEPKNQFGAIQAYNEGKSDLEFKRPGNIHNAMGFRYSVSANREIKLDGNRAAFDNIYAGIYAPEFAVFYEYQPFHSEWLGNIGIVGSVGVDYFYGVGQFGRQIRKPGNTGYFPVDSRTKVQFFTLPITLGINYRFNLLRILRPYAMIGPTLVGYLESRNDGGPTYRGHAEGFTTSLGVSILLDWISRGSTWDLYSQYAVKHYYLTLDYTRLTPFSEEDVSIRFEGISAGLTFEY